MGCKITSPPKKLRAAQAKSFATVYQATTDGFVKAKSRANGTGLRELQGFTDSSNPPTTSVAYDLTQNATNNDLFDIGFWVLKGNYWSVVAVGAMTNPVVSWSPLK